MRCLAISSRASSRMWVRLTRRMQWSWGRAPSTQHQEAAVQEFGKGRDGHGQRKAIWQVSEEKQLRREGIGEYVMLSWDTAAVGRREV